MGFSKLGDLMLLCYRREMKDLFMHESREGSLIRNHDIEEERSNDAK